MEKYIGAIVTLLVSLAMFAYGFGRMKQITSGNAEDHDKLQTGFDLHIAKTDIHIDPARDRESQRILFERLTKVEMSLGDLAREVRNESRAADGRQAVLLQEVRAALATLANGGRK